MSAHQPVKLQNLLITGFTPREALVVGHTCLGKSSKEIAKEIHCSPRNVENLRDAAKSRVQALNTPHLISEAFRHGMLRFLSVVLTFWLGSGLQPIVTQQLQLSVNDDQIRRTSRQSGRGGRHRLQLIGQDGLQWDADIGDFVPSSLEGIWA